MSMKTKWDENGTEKSVTSPMSLIITAFGAVEDIRKTVTPELRTDKGGSLEETRLVAIDLSQGKKRLGGSCLAQVYKQLGNETPDVDNAETLKGFFNAMQTLVRAEKVIAYHDISDGGLFTTVTEMAFAGHTGVDIDISKLSNGASDDLATLFNEEPVSYTHLTLPTKRIV